METEGEVMNIKFKYYIEKWNFGMDAAFTMREKLERETAWLHHVAEYLGLQHHYTNICTMIRYNDLKICGKSPTCFGIFWSYLGSYSTKKNKMM